MERYLLFGSVCAISGSITYYVCNEVYKIYIEKGKSQHYKIINPGLIMGLGIGILRAYKGRAILES